MENEQLPQNSDLAARLDDVLNRLAELENQVKAPHRSPPLGKPGVKDSTADIADYANERRAGMTWKEICSAWKGEHSNDPRNKKLNREKVREAWRRHFGDKRKGLPS